MPLEPVKRIRLHSVRAGIALAGIVAILSLVTGLTNIVVGVSEGPIAHVVPGFVSQTAGFTGTLTGFVLLLSVWGLRRRLRVAWFSTVALLPLTGLQGVIQASAYSLPLIVLSVVTLPALMLNRRRFDRTVELSPSQLGAIVALTATLSYGTIGAYALRDEFSEIDTVTDAFYFTIVTATTVGYGDMTPLSQQARLFGISLVVLGAASFAVALGSILGPAIEARFSRALGTMTDTRYELLEDHVLVLGYGDLTEPILEEFSGDVEFLVVTDDVDTAKQLRNQGYNVLVGDPSEDQPLFEAGIEHASVAIVATDHDANDAFTILSARDLNPDMRIVAAATLRENVEKLTRAGADIVLSPTVIGGRLLVRSALGDPDVERVIQELVEDTD